MKHKNLIVIGAGGVARSGKNTYCDIAQVLLERKRYKVKQFSFADKVRDDLAEFVFKKCDGIDIRNMTPEQKDLIRPLMVWYGTDFWRKLNINKWIDELDRQIKSISEPYHNHIHRFTRAQALWKRYALQGAQ